MLTIIRRKNIYLRISRSNIEIRSNEWRILTSFARDGFLSCINLAVTNMEFVVPRARGKDVTNRILRLHFRRRKRAATAARFSEPRKGWRDCGEHGDSITRNFDGSNADNLYSHRASVIRFWTLFCDINSLQISYSEIGSTQFAITRNAEYFVKFSKQKKINCYFGQC